MTTPKHYKPRPRRAHARFEAAARVEYLVDKDKFMVLSRNLSAGGMLLGGSSQLREGAQHRFWITLPDAGLPLAVVGKVLRVSNKGSQVQFVGNQELVTQRIALYAVRKVIPALASEVT